MVTICWAVIHHCGTAQAQALTDAGFENYAVNSGEFLKPANGPWSFTNDAGVVEPFAPNSSTGTLNTWSATLSAFEGQQYASTYAGGDSIRQGVTFPSAGQYAISVYAAAPSGTVTIPGVGTLNLTSGAFTFTLAGVNIGSLHTLLPGTGWSLFSDTFSIDKPGIYQLGIDNTVVAPYFINYDAFAIVAVPEPPSLELAVLGVLSAALLRTRNYRGLLTMRFSSAMWSTSARGELYSKRYFV
jgi:hypothetical protein